jgi:hypothetical protein
VVIVKGMVASGFCSPAFTWAQTATDAKMSSSAAVAIFSFIVVFLASQAPDLI